MQITLKINFIFILCLLLCPFVVYGEQDSSIEHDGYVAVVDDSISNKTIKTELSNIGSIDQISVVEDDKIVLLDLNVNENTAINKLSTSNIVEEFNPNYKYDLSGADPFLSNTNNINYQYFIENVNAENAWSILESANAQKTRVGVIDTGIDSKHEDLQQNIITLDQNKNYKQFAAGDEKSINDDPDVNDYHGTHVNGIIGATYNNSKGGAGVASGHSNTLIDVIPISASSDGYSLYTYDICKAIKYATDNNCRVINMSFGLSAHDAVLENCINQYFDQGVVFVAASGNDASSSFSCPADLSSVIAVNASNKYNQAAYWSDYGKAKDISAPGVDIQSTIGGDRYTKLSGTSMASPVITGIAGLVLDANPSLSPSEVRNILCASASGNGVFTEDLAYGVVNAESAVNFALSASDEISAESVTIRENSIDDDTYSTARVGETLNLSSLVLPANCLQNVIWESSDSSILTVSSSGVVTGITPGTATVTCKAGNKSDSIEIKIKQNTDVESIKINNLPENNTFAVSDGAGKFEVEVEPAALLTNYKFESSDNSILFVDSLGDYEVKKAGVVDITATDLISNKSVTETIYIKNDVRSISFKTNTNYIRIGDTFTFTAVADGSNLYKPEVQYSTTNDKLSINALTGKCTAKKLGYSYVVAKTSNGILNHIKVTILKKNYTGKDYALKVTKTNVKTKAKLRWKAQPLAKSYTVEKKVGKGKWITLTTTTKLSYFDTKWKATSLYRVSATYVENGKQGKYGYSSVIKLIKTYSGKDYALKSRVFSKKVNIFWKKQPYAKSYTVEKKIGKGKWKKIKTTKSLKYTDKKNKKNVVYYRVKANPDKNNIVCIYKYSNTIKIKK